MQFVPWQNVADWHCKACGYCCKLYSVVLGFNEWLNIARSFGQETTVTGLDRFYIKRTSDGSCGFLCNKTNNYYCGLQGMKPEACKIWPFKVPPNPNTATPTKQHTTTLECDCTFTGTPCATAYAMERQHGTSATQP